MIDWLLCYAPLIDIAVTIAVGIIGFLFIRQQINIQRNQVRHDLFERRMKIITDVRELLTLVDKHKSVEPDVVDLELIRRSLRESRFLFKKDVQDYLADIDADVGTLENLSARIRERPQAHVLAVLLVDFENIIEKFRGLRTNHEERFSNYMNLQDVF